MEKDGANVKNVTRPPCVLAFQPRTAALETSESELGSFTSLSSRFFDLADLDRARVLGSRSCVCTIYDRKEKTGLGKSRMISLYYSILPLDH